MIHNRLSGDLPYFHPKAFFNDLNGLLSRILLKTLHLDCNVSFFSDLNNGSTFSFVRKAILFEKLKGECNSSSSP